MQKTFKILGREPYNFTARDGKVYPKCRYQTDSDALDLFALNLEVGKSYDFEEQEKEANGRVYKNWVLVKPKNTLELRIEVLESRVSKLESMSFQDEPDLSQIPF